MNIFKIMLLLILLTNSASAETIQAQTNPPIVDEKLTTEDKNIDQVGSNNSETAQEHIKRGGDYASRGEFDRALEEENKAIAIDPNNADAYFYRASVYVVQKDFERSFADLNKVIELNPNYVDAYINRGNGFAMKGNLVQAISDFSKAIEINPSKGDAYINRARAYAFNKQYDQSWEDIHKAESLGGNINPQFLEGLRRASGRQN